MRREIIDLIKLEQQLAQQVHGPFPQDFVRAGSLAAEEFGEMVREINDFTRSHGIGKVVASDLHRIRQSRSSRFKIAHEAVQLASVAIQIVNLSMEDAECRKELFELYRVDNGGRKEREPYLPQS